MNLVKFVVYLPRRHCESLLQTKIIMVMFNVLLVLTIVGIVSLVSITLYTTFTPVGSATIQGVQGRYFLPILPIIVICIVRLANFKETTSTRLFKTVRISIAAFLVITALMFLLVNF